VIAVAAAYDSSPPSGLYNKPPEARAFPRTVVDPAGRSPPLLLRLTAAGGKALERLPRDLKVEASPAADG
jgi:hypothetical protein